MTQLAGLLQDVSIPEIRLSEITQMLSIETGTLASVAADASMGPVRLELMMAVAVDVPGESTRSPIPSLVCRYRLFGPTPWNGVPVSCHVCQGLTLVSRCTNSSTFPGAGLVAQAFHGNSSTSQFVSSGDRLLAGSSVRGKDEADLRAACQSLRILLRSHIAAGEASSGAFCTWTVAIVESASQQTQAMLLAAGLLDPVFDRIQRSLHVRASQLTHGPVNCCHDLTPQIPRTSAASFGGEVACGSTACAVQGRAQVRLERLHPEMAVLLSLAAHPGFPKHAMSGLPTMCTIVQEAAATSDHDTLKPVLAAVWAVCRECLAKLSFSDASSLCTALLSTLPNPDIQRDQGNHFVDSSAESTGSMVAAVACVALVLGSTKAKTPVWLRLRTTVMSRLVAGLSTLTHAVVTTCVAAADLFGELHRHDHYRGFASQCIGPHEIANGMSLLSLAAGITAHVVRVHKDALLHSDQGAAPAVTRSGVLAMHGPDPGTGQRVSSSASLGALIADFLMDILVPAHVFVSTQGGRGCGDQDSASHVDTGMHVAVFSSLIAFLEAALGQTHGMFLSFGTSGDTEPNAMRDSNIGVHSPGVPASDVSSGSRGHQLVASAIYLGWQCISCGYIARAVERRVTGPCDTCMTGVAGSTGSNDCDLV